MELEIYQEVQFAIDRCLIRDVSLGGISTYGVKAALDSESGRAATSIDFNVLDGCIEYTGALGIFDMEIGYSIFVSGSLDLRQKKWDTGKQGCYRRPYRSWPMKHF